ncbi:MAG TPA: YihY/virulence factor BrkB family protein, partial [Bacteroidales bacterium]|nr:YihY/virulence factor BrkB family protein [Bacteroidales bacterium]
LWVIQLALTIVAALVGIVFGRQILDVAASFVPNLPTEGIIEILRIVVPIALLFGVLTLAYMFIPYINIKFKYAFPGAVFSTVVWIVFTVLFQFYVSNFANYSRFYGTLGAVIALLLWLLLTSIIMMVGASLNAYLIEIRGIQDPYISKDKEKKKEELEEMKDEEDKKDDVFELDRRKGKETSGSTERDKIERNIFKLEEGEKDDEADHKEVSHHKEEDKSTPERKFNELKKRVEDTLEDKDDA